MCLCNSGEDNKGDAGKNEGLHVGILEIGSSFATISQINQTTTDSIRLYKMNRGDQCMKQYLNAYIKLYLRLKENKEYLGLQVNQ